MCVYGSLEVREGTHGVNTVPLPLGSIEFSTVEVQVQEGGTQSLYIGGSSSIHGQEGRLCCVVSAWASRMTMPNMSEPIYGTDHVYTPLAPDLVLLFLAWCCFGFEPGLL